MKLHTESLSLGYFLTSKSPKRLILDFEFTQNTTTCGRNHDEIRFLFELFNFESFAKKFK